MWWIFQSRKECQNNLTMTNQDQIHDSITNTQTTELIRYPTPISLARLSILAQHITADFQLSQEAWNKLSNQMNEMAKTNKLLKKAVKITYYKLTNLPKWYPKKALNHLGTPKNTDKKVKFVANSNKDSEDINRILKGNNVKNDSKKTP